MCSYWLSSWTRQIIDHFHHHRHSFNETLVYMTMTFVCFLCKMLGVLLYFCLLAWKSNIRLINHCNSSHGCACMLSCVRLYLAPCGLQATQPSVHGSWARRLGWVTIAFIQLAPNRIPYLFFPSPNLTLCPIPILRHLIEWLLTHQ